MVAFAQLWWVEKLRIARSGCRRTFQQFDVHRDVVNAWRLGSNLVDVDPPQLGDHVLFGIAQAAALA
tara:strand:+ start:2066 stop:2266 length:201 start_codon:yes stop_codon:yes gene_type:complete